ncbi:retrotransposon protein, putative, ty3-gypsy subclass, partial [Tanacetum coccineum]
VMWFGDWLCVPSDPTLHEAVLSEAHGSPFSIHLGLTKMYGDLKQHFWWNGMKQDIATFVGKCLICQQVKIEHQRVGERVIEGPELIEVTNEKVAIAKEKLKEARSGVRRSGIKGKLSPRFIGPFEILDRVGEYPLDQIRKDLSLAEEPEKILDRQERVMRSKTIPFIKILWKNHPEREAAWETEESMRASYPRFFS